MSEFLTEVIVDGSPVITPVKAYGWGDDAVAVQLIGGRPMQIMIRRNDESQIAICVAKDGKVTVTDHGGLGFQQYAEQSVKLYPSRPWKE